MKQLFIKIIFIGILFSCSQKRSVDKSDLIDFLNTNPYPGITKTSYRNGNDSLFLALFLNTGQYAWTGSEWHKKYVYPQWIKYIKDNDLKFSERYATNNDFCNFLAERPFTGFDSSSYDFCRDTKFYYRFELTGKYSWIGYEWHRDNILSLWNKYKNRYNLKPRLPEKLATPQDFRTFLKTKPLNKVNETSYQNGTDEVIINLFLETGKYDWTAKENDKANLFPLWQKYRLDNDLY